MAAEKQLALFVARRAAWAVALAAAVSAITFAVFYALPAADPAALRAGRHATPERIEQIRRQLGLDRSWPEQYALFVSRLVTDFDLGYSYELEAPVRQQILERLPATISLTLGAVVIWLAAGLPTGVISALRRGRLADRAAMGAALVAVSAPVYWLGLVALYLFSADIGRFPLLPGADSYVPLTRDPGAWLGSLVLPWLVLAAGFAAFYARLLRGNLVEVLSEDHIRAARARGLSERRVLRHALRSAGTPIVTVLGLDVGILLGGAVLTETVFNIPGVGRMAFDAIQQADLPAIQGTVLFATLFIVAANLVVDIAYALLDPRVARG